MLTLIREERAVTRSTAKIGQLSITTERLRIGGEWRATVYDVGVRGPVRVVGHGTGDDEHEAIADAMRDAAGTCERLASALEEINRAGGLVFAGPGGE